MSNSAPSQQSPHFHSETVGSAHTKCSSPNPLPYVCVRAVIYVAEAAQSLCRNADFEVPFLRKQAARYQQQLADLERRKAEALRSAAAAAADFQQAC